MMMINRTQLAEYYWMHRIADELAAWAEDARALNDATLAHNLTTAARQARTRAQRAERALYQIYQALQGK